MAKELNFRQELTACFGFPVAENPTQAMIEPAYQALGIDWRYLTLEVKPENLQAAVAGGWAWLAVVGMLMSVIGAYYYLRVVWYMYFEEGEDKAVLQAGNDTRVVLSLNGLAVLALGIVPGWLWALCTAVFAAL